jgi:hypothetical protein
MTKVMCLCRYLVHELEERGILIPIMATYSCALFFVVLCAIVCLVVVCLETVRSFHRRPLLYGIWFICAVGFLVSATMSRLAPWSETAAFFRTLTLFFVIPTLPATALVLHTSLSHRTEDLVKQYEGALLDAVRESIVIFDSGGRVISFGRENPLPSVLVYDQRPEIDSRHPCAFLARLLAHPEERSGTLRLESRTLFWRFKPLPGARGSLLTLLDTTREQELADSLARTGTALAARQRLLLSIENLSSEAAAARIREHLSSEIDREVRGKLGEFLSSVKDGVSLEKCLVLAEESIAEVRSLVNELAPRRNTQ